MVFPCIYIVYKCSCGGQWIYFLLSVYQGLLKHSFIVGHLSCFLFSVVTYTKCCLLSASFSICVPQNKIAGSLYMARKAVRVNSARGILFPLFWELPRPLSPPCKYSRFYRFTFCCPGTVVVRFLPHGLAGACVVFWAMCKCVSYNVILHWSFTSALVF